MSIRKALGAYKWSKNEAVDQDVVAAITSEADYSADPDEQFLFTSPALRYDFPYISAMEAWLCVTNKRIFLWKGKWQSLEEMAVPNINQIDVSTLTRFRMGNVRIYGIPLPMNALLIKGRFFNGNDPSDSSCDEKRRERIHIRKGAKGIEYFAEACAQLGLVMGDPGLNGD
jgi:hypothetical protein